MIGLAANESATSPGQHGRRLIQEARLARMKDEPLTRSLQGEIDRTRRASDVAANLARLIDSFYAGPDARNISSACAVHLAIYRTDLCHGEPEQRQ